MNKHEKKIQEMEDFIEKVETFLTQAKIDRRRSGRHTLVLKMRHRIRNGDGYSKVQAFHAGLLKNISKHGMLVCSKVKPPKSGELEVVVTRGNNESELRAFCKVIYTERDSKGIYNTGVEIQKVLT